MREADLPPTPGSRVSSLMRFASGGAVNLEESRNLHPAGHRADGARHLLVHFARGFVDRGDDEVLEHFDVVRIDGFLVDGDGEELFGTVHRRFHHAAASASLDLQRGHALLHLFLHLLDLLHQLLRIHEVSLRLRGSAVRDSSMSAPRCFWNAWTTGSSRRGEDDFAAGAPAAGESVCTAIVIVSPKTSAAIDSSAERAPLT